ncbi:SirB2 family protein [Paraglaciecola arctica]|uniref:Invasion gene expression up-regulator, SirB n=1 Tax=Paraglaciecola arctica BSs20135 TaxID=493475 RepID=K6YEF2_9ALTE|nr:SirB2 family protein [Paraglaciecola arctica]GAC22311.1 invasion gene expression up-regulator, SirB [Paraglaciecola arctica BSs20135]|tara:strand:+ start:958 stop:1332 length:375 start_codon:yes stop_codon:yes gene_type:complete
MYEIVKHIHLTAIALSVLLFLLRFVLNAMQSPMLQKKWLKILPHIVDTLLLVSAAILCVLLKQYPFVDAWVTEKLLALVMYIFMVTLALKLGRTGFMRGIGLVGALSWIAFAGMVAVSKQPILF